VGRHLVELHNTGRVESAYTACTGKGERAWPVAGIDDDDLGGKKANLAGVHRYLYQFRSGEARLSKEQVDPLGLLDCLLASMAPTSHDISLAPANHRHVNGDRSSVHPVIGCAPS